MNEANARKLRNFTSDHCLRQAKQNWCTQLSVKDLFDTAPRQMEQLSGEALPEESSSPGSSGSSSIITPLLLVLGSTMTLALVLGFTITLTPVLGFSIVELATYTLKGHNKKFNNEEYFCLPTKSRL